jgi:hypothetical protein
VTVRVIAAALAVVVAAFLGARLHDHDRCEDARTEVFAFGLGRGGDLDAAIERIRQSCRGTAGLVGAAAALARTDRRAEALALAREATEREPESAEAWRTLARVARGHAPAEARAAERRLAELDPLR